MSMPLRRQMPKKEPDIGEMSVIAAFLPPSFLPSADFQRVCWHDEALILTAALNQKTVRSLGKSHWVKRLM